MKLNSILCLLLLASQTQAAFWNKNGNKDGEDRRRLTEVPVEAMDVDAATGTVKKVISEEQQRASTCDGQMALSLATANEGKLYAEGERDELKKQVAALEKSLGEMVDINKQLETKVEEVIREKDAKVNSIMQSLKSSTGDIVKEYEMKLSDLAKAHANEVASLNSQIASAQESSSAKIRELENKIVENAKAAEEAKEAELNDMQYFHSQEVNKLKDEMAAQKRLSIEIMAKQEQEAKAKFKESMDARDKMIKALNKKVREAEEDAEDAEEELAMWRAVHENRTYCNYTYMTEDIYWAGEAAYNKSAELSWNAYESAATLALMAQEKTYVAYEEAKVYTNKATAAVKPHYDKKVKPLVDKHVTPFVDKHVNPLVAKVMKAYENEVLPNLKKFKTKIDPRLEQIQRVYKEQFDKLARKYATGCDKAFQASNNLARKNNLKAFDIYLAPSWKASCDHPKETLKGAQIAVAVALLLPYTFSILRLVLWFVLLPLRIFIAITPLRFIFYSSKKKTPTQKAVGEVRVKSKKTNFSQ